MKIILVAGIRPNFVKVAPLIEALARAGSFAPLLVHTGQHYDFLLSQAFFQDLQIPEPQYHLEIDSGPHGQQTGRMLERLEKVFLKEKPDLTVVFGDANSTLAGALAAAKLHIPVAHVEAGLRSFNRKMPEELNRRLTDHASDFLFAPERSAVENLVREGIAQDKIHFVGNIMIDSLLKHLDRLPSPHIEGIENLSPCTYAVLTLHRPENVDNQAVLKPMLEVLKEYAEKMPLFWPLHPRTRTRLKEFGLDSIVEPFHIIEPLRYLDMLALMRNARVVLTDSGGIQEETTILDVPCLTLRTETERPVTVEVGTNMLVGVAPERIREHTEKFLDLNFKPKESRAPELWDGKTAERIVNILLN
jgi:UDP-N-acetylglucosamine 2-epimerase (non-hydrolysing)